MLKLYYMTLAPFHLLSPMMLHLGRSCTRVKFGFFMLIIILHTNQPATKFQAAAATATAEAELLELGEDDASDEADDEFGVELYI